MQSAQAMWKMLDDMAASDPEEYDNFLKSQMQGMDGGGVAAVTPKESEVPLAAFCVRMRLEGGDGLFINVCQHERIKAPSAVADGSVPLAVGVPRSATHGGKPAQAVDVVVNSEVTRRAEADKVYREEVAALAAQCVREIFTQRRLLAKMILPGYRALPSSEARYVGTPQPFVDAQGPPRNAPADDATPDNAIPDIPASLMQMLGGLGGRGKGGQGGGGGGKGSRGGGKGGSATGPSFRAGPDDDDGDGLLDGLRLPGMPPPPAASGGAPATTGATTNGRPPASSTAKAVAAETASAAPPRPLVEEVSSQVRRSLQ